MFCNLCYILNRTIRSELEKRGGWKMLEAIGRIARNGHLTIPSKIRKILNIEDGDM